MLLRQVLIGLLTNAFKNTPPPGAVTRSRAAGDGEDEVVIEVDRHRHRNRRAAEIDRIFERFYRGSGSLEQEGFGLGLSIAKRMVDVMGGEIGVDSVEGRGQHLLGAPARGATGPDPGSVSARSMDRILIADDEPSVRDVGRLRARARRASTSPSPSTATTPTRSSAARTPATTC